eukprot:42677-Eustigmatos_ZCMA.PRE.1
MCIRDSFFSDDNLADELFGACLEFGEFATQKYAQEKKPPISVEEAKKGRVRGGFGEPGTELIGDGVIVAHPWEDTVFQRIYGLLADKLGVTFNYTLYNLYENEKGISFHSDNEDNSVPIIASLTFGGT